MKKFENGILLIGKKFTFSGSPWNDNENYTVSMLSTQLTKSHSHLQSHSTKFF